MRTCEIWQKKVLPKVIQRTFTPRLQKDIKAIYIKVPEKVDSLYIYGDVGTGKTLYASWLLLQEQKNLYLSSQVGDCIFVSNIELFEEIKSGFNSSIDIPPVLDRYKKAHLLVLDDLGIVKPTDWVLNILYLLVNWRYENLKTTIFTSNLNLAELAIYLGDDRVVSRIERMCRIVRKKNY